MLNKIKIFSMFFLILIPTMAFTKEDEVLDKLIKKYSGTQDESEIDKLSSDIFFIGNSHLISGDSGKALIYFKTALQMTPKHAHTIENKISESVNVYKHATLSIPKENCEDVKARTDFIKEISPDSYQEIIAAFPNCLNIQLVKKKLESDTALLNIEKEKVKTEKAQVDQNIQKINEFNETKFKFLNLKLPESNTELEKKAFAALGDELGAILKNKDFLPDDIISTMQDESLKLLKIESGKAELDSSKITETISGIKIPINFSILKNQILKDEFISRYKQLLEIKGADVKFKFSTGEIQVTKKVSNYLLRNRFADINFERHQHTERPNFPIFPAILVLKFEMIFKDPLLNGTAMIPFGLSIINDSFTPVLFYEKKKYSQAVQEFLNNKEVSYENQVYLFEQSLSNEALKQIVDIKISLDVESTIALNHSLRDYPVYSREELKTNTFRDEKMNLISGINLNNRKEGLFYIFKDGKRTGSILYKNDQPVSAGSLITEKSPNTDKYCMDTVCHSYINMNKVGEDYKISFKYSSANCALVDDIEGLLKKTQPTKWKGQGAESEKLSLRFENDKEGSDTIFLGIENSCMALTGEHKFVKNNSH